MPKLTKDDRRAGLEYAKQLEVLARSAPNFFVKRETYRAIDRIRRVLAFTAQQKRSWVLHLLQHGSLTYSELSAETGFRRQEVQEIAQWLAEQRYVELRPLSTGKRGQRRVLVVRVER